jgi:hypothetical protein
MLTKIQTTRHVDEDPDYSLECIPTIDYRSIPTIKKVSICCTGHSATPDTRRGGIETQMSDAYYYQIYLLDQGHLLYKTILS